MEEIDWAQAPNDADAAATAPGAIAVFGPWRKFIGEVVYYYEQNEWHVREGVTAEQWKRGNKHVLRPAPKENNLPNGKVWFEHATYWNPEYPEQGGLFFTDTHHYWEGKWQEWSDGNFEWWEKLEGTIKRFPDGIKPQVKQEQPKRPVGWWA